MPQLKQPLNVMIALLLLALTNFSSATPLEAPKHSNGIIYFYNDKNEEKCTLAIPEKSRYFNFGSSNEHCENNMVSTFKLVNVPSATLIQFHANDGCSSIPLKNNFFIKLKTVKDPTDWSAFENMPSIDSLRSFQEGWLLPNRNIRIESSFVGSNFQNKSLNEHLSCVYIERSQPVN